MPNIQKLRQAYLLCLFLLSGQLCHAGFVHEREIDSTLKFLESYQKDDAVKVAALARLSSLVQASNLHSAENYARQALEVADRIGEDSLRCRALSQLGNVYNWERKTTNALNTYFRQLEIARVTGNDYYMQDAYLGLGYVYELENEWDKALSYSLRAVYFAEKSKDPFDKAFSYNHIGSQYLGIGNHQLAEEYLKKAISIFSEGGYKDQQGDAHINLAKVYSEKKEYDLAVAHFNQAISIFTALAEPYQIADTYQQMGDMYVKRGMYKEARKAYENTILHYDKEDVAEADYALAVMGLGVVAWAEKRYAEASSIIHEEFKKIKEARIIEPQLRYLKFMAMADSASGNLKEAYDHMQEYARLYDAYYNEERTKAAQRLLIEFDLEKKEQENEQLKARNKLQQQNLTIIAVVGGALLAAGVFLYLLYKQKTGALKSLKEMQHATEEKNIQLAVINNVKDKLISMIAHDVRSPLTSLQNILYVTREQIINPGEFARLSKVLDNEIHHLLGMLDNTLLWAREQIQALTVSKENFNLHQVAEDVTSLYNHAIQNKQLKIDNQIPPGLEVFSDKEIVHTILRNMVSNAIKFTPEGKRIVLSTERQNGQRYVTVQDEGNGIPPNILEKIRKKEFITTRGTNKEKGTGLGLIFTQDLIAKLNENLYFNTVPGEGTKVMFTINEHDLANT